jgi:hypothetical protein
MEHLEGLFAVLKPKEYGWEFLERGLAYFMKALQSTGEEQLLWHITALEALLGERGEGATERLTRRISMILGGTDDERDSIGKEFKKLYDFRCDLVHGNRFKNLVLVEHLTRSHIFARKTLLWFLHFLQAVQTSISEHHKSGSLPSRHQLLKFLDGDNDAHQTLHWLMDKLPAEFPHVREWVE